MNHELASFRPGTKVWLDIGGPMMVVTHTVEPCDRFGATVCVKWFAGRFLQKGAFPPEALTTDGPDEEGVEP